MLINYFHPVIGGTETAAYRLSRELIKKGIDTFVVTRKIKSVKKHEEIDGIRIYRLFTAGHGGIASIVFMVSAFFFLLKRRNEFSVIHAHLVSSHTITAVLLGKLLNKKVVIKFAGGSRAGDIALSSKSFMGRLKISLIRKRGDYFVCPSREIEHEIKMSGFPVDKVRVIPNGVDTKLFTPVDENTKRELRKQFKLPDVPLVIYVGRLHTGKGLDVLLKAWKKVIEEFVSARLLLIGDGIIREVLILQSRELKIEESVFFIGSSNEVNKYLQLSNIFVLPSLSEGMSNALLEAMSCGVPVVTTNIGGTNEIIINNENGILVEVNNVSQLAEGIVKLLKNRTFANQIGINERKAVEEGYSIEKVTEDYLKLYEEL